MIYLMILIGFIMLIYGGNVLVNGSVAVAKRMHISPLLIGLILVGFGTSTPELMTSLIAAFSGKEGISVGNVVGSNIANILLILGVAISIHAIPIHKASFKRDSTFLMISTLVLCLALLFGQINIILGMIMCGTLGYYMYYSYNTDKKHQKELEKPSEERKALSPRKQKAADRELGIEIAKTIVGIILTIAGAKFLVDNAAALANSWGVDEKIIGLTIVSLGTSLPELVTSIVAARKKQGSLALGNVIGSNIYNALFILGATALVVPVKVPSNILIDLVIMLATTGLLIGLGQAHKLKRWVGILFIGLYAVYMGYLFL